MKVVVTSLSFFLTVNLLGIFPAPVAAGGDPCLDVNHIPLNETKRSTAFIYKAGTPIHDDTSLPGFWYRFVSGAGGYIPETCPKTIGSCNTMSQIWMIGKLPPDNSTTPTAVQMCINNGVSCTSRCFPINVKNCGAFAVYELKSITEKNTAYCAGYKKRCLAGEVSPTGFTPCDDPTKLPAEPKAPKVALVETTSTKSFRFDCVLQNPDKTVKHRIKWFAGSNQLLLAELNPTETRHEIQENQLNFRGNNILGNYLRCEVSAVKNIPAAVGTKWISSAKPGYFLGVQVVDGKGKPISEVVLEKKDFGSPEPKKAYVKSTIPVICNSKLWDIQKAFFPCAVELRQRVQKWDDYVAGLAASRDCAKESTLVVKDIALKVGFGSCGVPLQSPSTSDYLQHPIRIQARKDNEFNLKDVVRYLDFYVDASYQTIWNGYSPPSLKVIVQDKSLLKGKKAGFCRSHTDPHIDTFDNKRHNIYHEGEFVLYENIKFNFRVHIFAKKCDPQYQRNHGSCNCGLAAQAGDDVIVIDRCKTFKDINNNYGRMPSYAVNRRVMRLRVYQTGPMTDGFTFQRLTESDHYLIQFPHGAEVKLELDKNYGWEVKVTPASMDLSEDGKPAEVRGLCGTFNGESGDDFLKKDGTQASSPKKFHKEWQVKKADSLYKGKAVGTTTSFTGKKVCDCIKVENKGVTVCDYRSACSKFKDLLRQLGEINYLRRKREASHDYVQDFDDTKFQFTYNDTPLDPDKMPWVKGWTEVKARAHCVKHIGGSAAVNACKGVPGVDETKDIEMCIMDIKVSGGSTMFVAAAAEAVKSECMDVVTTNYSLWKVDPAVNVSGTNISFALPPSDIIEKICPNDCSDNGRCVQGSCICDPGFIKADCSENEDTPPEVFMLPQDGLCDTTRRPCVTTPVIGDGFIDGYNITCHIETVEITEQGYRSTGEEHETTPEFESYMELHCPLPAKHVRARRQAPVGTPAVGYNLTISNNGKLRSVTSAMLLVYDSRCQACNSTTGLCHLKPNTCLIRGYCQLPGDRSGTDACLTCDPDTSTSGWTKIDYCPTTTTEATTLEAETATEEGKEDGLGLPVWAVAVICVAAGAVIAVAVLVAVRLVKKTSVAPPPSYEEEMKPAQRANMLFKVPERPVVYE